MKPKIFYNAKRKKRETPVVRNRLTKEQREQIIDLLEYYHPPTYREIARECCCSISTISEVKKKYCQDSPKFYGNVLCS